MTRLRSRYRSISAQGVRAARELCPHLFWKYIWQKYFLKNIFGKDNFFENIFGKNIFCENIFGKNIWQIFLVKIFLMKIFFSDPCPHLTALQITPTSSRLLISDFWSWVWQTNERTNGLDGAMVVPFIYIDHTDSSHHSLATMLLV